MRSPLVIIPRLSAALLLLLCVSCVSARLAVMSIDLGGEFMKIAIVKPGVPMEVVLNKDSGRKTNTMVAFRDGERQFSNQAMSTAVKFPPKAICYLNHVIGRQFDDPQVQLYRERFPYYNLVKDEVRGTVLFKLDDESVYTPEELLGMIIEKAREYAQEFAEQDIKDAVITVPSFYNQAERRAVLQAADLVGVNVLQLMNDNSAVALNYGVFRRKNFNSTMQYYMFYDMGATSTTVSIVGYNVVKTKEGAYMESNPQLTVRGIGFDRTLGGLEFTLRLRNHLASVFDGQKKTTLKVRENKRSMAKLFKEAERVKKVLSANMEHAAQIEGLLDEKDFRAMVSRAELEEMTTDLMARVTKPVEDALKVSEITLPEITEVILMGGATRIPKLQELLLKFLGRSELGKSINTDEAAAMGAVYQAAYLGKGFKVKKFGVRDGNMYPISVEFEKQKTADSDSDDTPAKTIKRTLFGRMNPYPQKKVMTFNRHSQDFGFKVIYSDLSFLTEEDKKSFGSPLISEYKLQGVSDALTKNKDAESKGIKAHFRMDESGILNLERVESVFERNSSQEAEAAKSAWSKLGSAIGGLFGGSTENEDTKVEESTEEDSIKPKSSSTEEDRAKEKTTEEEGKMKPEGEQTQQQDKNSTAKEEPSSDDQEKEEEKADEKKEEEKKEGSEEKTKKEEDSSKKEDDKKESDKESGKADAGKDSKNDTKKEEGPKVTTVKEEIKSQHEILDIPDMSADVVKKTKKRLSNLRKADEEKAELEKVKNEVEAFIFDYQDKLSDEEGSYYKCVSAELRETLQKQLSEASDWLYEQDDDTKKSQYSDKLKELTDANKPVIKRVFEMEERPKAMEALRAALNQTTVFLETVKNMTDLEDPIFTSVELNTLEKLINESKEWSDKQVKAQKKLKPYEDPVLLAEDIGYKIGALDREMRYLINKAKNFKPKPKPKPKNETNSNETKTTDGQDKDKDSETTTEKPTTDSTQEEAPPTEEPKPDQEEKQADKKEDSTQDDASKDSTDDKKADDKKEEKSSSDSDKEEKTEEKTEKGHSEL